MIPITILRNLGLSAREENIYHALLAHGPITIAGLARETGIHRPALYRILPALQERGLISTTPKGKQRHFVAESPEKLKALVDSLSASLTKALPDLQRAYASSRARPIVTFHEGRKGLQVVYDDLVRSCRHGDTYYRYGSRKSTTNWRRYVPQGFIAERDRKQLQRFVITSTKQDQAADREMNQAVKVVPASYNLFQYDIVQFIYANKVAFMDYSTETALIIENAALAAFQKNMFKLLYEKL